MAYLAVDKDGQECILGGNEPYRKDIQSMWAYWVSDDSSEGEWYNNKIDLPKNSIEKLIGRKLTWEDEPVEI